MEKIEASEPEKVITKEYLKNLLKTKSKEYYELPGLNTALYINHKNFSIIDNLEDFTGLRVLFLDGNCIKKLQGLDKLVNLRTLCLQENLIEEIQGLDKLVNLITLNLSDNCIKEVKGLNNSQQLTTLQLNRNFIGVNGNKDLICLTSLPHLQNLELADNKIEDEQVIDEIFRKIPNLTTLNITNNQFIRKVKNYRKFMLHSFRNLKCLDNQIIKQDEQNLAIAFMEGGTEEEEKERQKQKNDLLQWHLNYLKKNPKAKIKLESLKEQYLQKKNLEQQTFYNMLVPNLEEIDNEESSQQKQISNSQNQTKQALQQIQLEQQQNEIQYTTVNNDLDQLD